MDWAAQPPTVGMQNGSSVRICTRCTHVFFARSGHRSVCSVGAYQQKFLHRSSGGSLLGVHCWLGASDNGRLVCACVVLDSTGGGWGRGRQNGSPGVASRIARWDGCLLGLWGLSDCSIIKYAVVAKLGLSRSLGPGNPGLSLHPQFGPREPLCEIQRRKG